MTSADFSQFVVTARLLSLKPRLRDLPSYGRTLSGLYPLGLLSAVRIVIGLLLLVQHCPCLSALYQVLVHRANLLPPTSFRFRLTADTLVFGCNLPTIRAVWGLAPVRARSCWANTKKSSGSTLTRSLRRTAAAYSPTWWGSTIGDGGLNFSVRNGKRWFPAAIATAICYLREILGSLNEIF